MPEDLLPHQRLAAGAHERHGLHRRSQDWLDDRWADDATRVLVLRGNRMRTLDGLPEWIAAADAPEGERVLLGEQGGVTHFAVLIDDRDTGEEWQGLRAVLARAAEETMLGPLLLHAVGLAEWRWATRFCPRCAGGLAPRSAGHELVCSGCGAVQFPRTDAAVIMAIAHGEPGTPEEKLLMARGAGWPEGRYSTLAGFLEPGETLEDTVRREVAEETGVPVGEIEYVGNQSWPLPASLMLGFTGRALDDAITIDEHEIAHARWFTRAELAAAWDDGSVGRPVGVSISRTLIESWFHAAHA